MSCCDQRADSSGVTVFPSEDRIFWRLRQEPPVCARVQLEGGSVSLVAEIDTGGGIAVVVQADRPVTLEIETPFTTFVEQVPAGCTRYLLTYLDRTDVRTV